MLSSWARGHFVDTICLSCRSSTTNRSRINERKHGIPLAAATGFDTDTALLDEDDHQNYGEQLIAIGFLHGRLHVLSTERDKVLRAMRLRFAEPHEAVVPKTVDVPEVDEAGTDPENPPLTLEQMKRMVPFRERFPTFRPGRWSVPIRTRGPQKAPTKRLASVGLSVNVLARLRATGRGWQSRLDRMMAAELDSEEAAAKVK